MEVVSNYASEDVRFTLQSVDFFGQVAFQGISSTNCCGFVLICVSHDYVGSSQCIYTHYNAAQDELELATGT